MTQAQRDRTYIVEVQARILGRDGDGPEWIVGLETGAARLTADQLVGMKTATGAARLGLSALFEAVWSRVAARIGEEGTP